MNNPYIGVIIPFAGSFAPYGWAFCNGQLQSIANNSALYALIGTTYGGDGQTTFALPNLKGRIPIGQGTGLGLSSYTIGQTVGVESVTLTIGQMPAHVHPVSSLSLNAVTGAGNTMAPAGNYLATSRTLTAAAYAPNAGTGTTNNLNSGTVTANGSFGTAGGSQPFSILQPTLAITYIIALYGIFPSRN